MHFIDPRLGNFDVAALKTIPTIYKLYSLFLCLYINLLNVVIDKLRVGHYSCRSTSTALAMMIAALRKNRVNLTLCSPEVNQQPLWVLSSRLNSHHLWLHCSRRAQLFFSTLSRIILVMTRRIEGDSARRSIVQLNMFNKLVFAILSQLFYLLVVSYV